MSALQNPGQGKYTVLVSDMFHHGEDEDFYVGYFLSADEAREYARRRTRASVEENREESASPEDLCSRCRSFGEDCKVMGGDYAGFQELDYFVTHAATAEETDYRALERGWDLRVVVQP